jgi:hypothetical protein
MFLLIGAYNVTAVRVQDSLFVKATVRTPTCIPHSSPASCLPVSPRHDEHPQE